MKKNLVLFSILFLGFSVYAADSAEKSAPSNTSTSASQPGTATTDGTSVECTLSGDKRVLSLQKQGEGCKVEYTKNQQTSEIGAQKNGVDFCESLVDRVKSKLTQSGFECK